MIVMIVQARMGSTRLPGKVLRLIAGRPMLSYQIERLRRVRNCHSLVVATTVNASDQPIVDFCRSEGIAYSRGSESDVLSRYYEAARLYGAQLVVRLSSDCPLIDPGLIERAIDDFRTPPGRYDYLSNMLQPSWPYGMAVEVMTMNALTEAHVNATDPAEREHVTPFIYWHPERFRVKSLTTYPDISYHRWTVDTPEDFELVSRILEELYPGRPDFDMSDVLALLEAHPTWSNINAGVKQRVAQQTRQET